MAELTEIVDSRGEEGRVTGEGVVIFEDPGLGKTQIKNWREGRELVKPYIDPIIRRCYHFHQDFKDRPGRGVRLPELVASQLRTILWYMELPDVLDDEERSWLNARGFQITEDSSSPAPRIVLDWKINCDFDEHGGPTYKFRIQPGEYVKPRVIDESGTEPATVPLDAVVGMVVDMALSIRERYRLEGGPEETQLPEFLRFHDREHYNFEDPIRLLVKREDFMPVAERVVKLYGSGRQA